MKRNKEKQGGARRKTHALELKLQVLQQLNAGASVTDVCRAFGLAITTVALWRRAHAQGGYEALFTKTPGPAKANEAAPDPRREAVIALKKANPEYGTRRIRDVLKRFEVLPISETEVRRMLHDTSRRQRASANCAASAGRSSVPPGGRPASYLVPRAAAGQSAVRAAATGTHAGRRRSGTSRRS